MNRRVAEATKSCQSGERARVDTSYSDKLVENPTRDGPTGIQVDEIVRCTIGGSFGESPRPWQFQQPRKKCLMGHFALPLVNEKTRIENSPHANGPFSMAFWSWTAPLKSNNKNCRPQLGVPFAGRYRRVDFPRGHRFVRTSVGLP